jgi:alkylhydroperoxidase/carboxymuconolactone decarboxylase family protein YurZ
VSEATDKSAELERVTALRGFRFGLHDFLAEVDLPALKKLNDRLEASYINEQAVDRKTKELVIMAACAGVGDSAEHLRIHMHAAVQAGATPEEVLAVIDMIGYWVGSVKTIAAIEGWRRTFRPDLDPIDRVVELR